MFHLSNKAELEKACSGNGGNMLSLQSNRTPSSQITSDGGIQQLQ